jgi:glycosyltransferase involved in cell wall biosynthesis
MRILMPHYEISDFGGIINSTEGLIRGYRDLGHEVFPIMMQWRDFDGVPEEHPPVEGESVTGMVMDQRAGYKFPSQRLFRYKGGVKHWKRWVKEFDLIHWQVPIPTQTKANRGNHEWPDLYDVSIPQVAHSHDGNIFNTPWFAHIVDRLRGVGCVHTCALNGAKKCLPVPLSLVPSPQWDIEKRMEGGLKGRERYGWLSLQTFKRWKRVDDLVRAVPFMTHDGPRQLAGGGIERYYMTSEEKVRPVYQWRMGDQDLKKRLLGKTIWQAALDGGMKYLDYIDNEQRDGLLRKRTALIDPSWSETYAKFGAHFNRVVIDALICGAVPIMRDWKDPTSPLQPHIHFAPMPPTEAGPVAIAKMIDDVCRDDWSSWMVRAREVLPLFEAKRAAGIFLELAEGRGDTRGRRSAAFELGSQEAMQGFFKAV